MNGTSATGIPHLQVWGGSQCTSRHPQVEDFLTSARRCVGFRVGVSKLERQGMKKAPTGVGA